MGYVSHVGSGWGEGNYPSSDASATVTVQVWRHDPLVARDTLVHDITVVHPAKPPTVLSQVFAMSSAELATGSKQVVAAPGQAGDVLSYRISAGNEDGSFRVDEETGELSVAPGAQADFSRHPARTLAVEARAGALAGAGAVTVVVAGGNAAPTITGGLAHEVEEGAEAGTSVGQVLASDPDVSDSVLFSIVAGNVGNAFRIGTCDGTIRVSQDASMPLNYLAIPEYTLTVMAYDDAPIPRNDTAQVVISVLDVNDPPECSALTRSIAETAAPGDNVGVPLAATDPENDDLTWAVFSGATHMFSLDASTGQLSVAAGADGLDFETTPAYTMSILVSDTEPLSAMCAVTVEVTDANDPPEFLGGQPPVLTVPEDAAPGDAVGIIVGTDDDGDTVVVTEVGTPSSVFEIVSGSVFLRSGQALDFETTASYDLNVQLDDGESQVQGTVTIEVLDANDAPTLDDVAVSVSENVPAGTLLAALEPTDVEGDFIVLTVGGGNGWFAVDSGTFNLVTTDSAALDFESGTTSYAVSILARDNGTPQGSTTATVTVTVTDADDAPTVTGCDTTTVWRERPGYSVIEGVVLTPHSVFNEEVATMWEFTSATDAASCRTACLGQSGCAAWTWFSASYALTAWRQQCYGRTDDYDAMQLQDSTTAGQPSLESAELTAPCLQATVDEGAASGTSLGNLAAHDQDGSAVTWTMVQSSDNNEHGWLAVASDGSVTLASSSTDADAYGTEHYAVAVAEDGTGQTTEAVVYLHLNPIDEPPAVTAASITAALPTGSPAGTAVGGALRGVDPEGAAVTYAVSGTDAAKFAVDTATGQLYV